MQDEVKIEEIKIKLGDKEASLTLSQARSLWEVLDSLFTDRDGETVYVPYYAPCPLPDKWGDWEITCSGNTYQIDLTSDTA